MTEKICMVAGLGMPEHEARLAQSILQHARVAHEISFEWVRELQHAHVVIMNADNPDAIAAWHEIARGQMAPVWILLTAKDTGPEYDYCLHRPLAPAKLLPLLERIAIEQLENMLGEQLFAGDAVLRSQQPASHGETAKMRALVVDDSPTIRKQISMVLESTGMSVDFAENGEGCLEKLVHTKYDIVFLDVVLPGIDGYDVCRRIRRNLETRELPVIMLTAKTSAFDRIKGNLAGCTTYLIKPVEREKFFRVLQENLVLSA